ncbi:hypothetical protein C4E44_34490, partial [Pseudomonas sp. MWU12-2312b]
MNETYLELGGSNYGMVELGKRLAFQIWMVLCTAFVVPVLICLWLVAISPPEIDREFFDIVGDAVQVFATGSLLFILPVGAFIYGMLSNVRT